MKRGLADFRCSDWHIHMAGFIWGNEPIAGGGGEGGLNGGGAGNEVSTWSSCGSKCGIDTSYRTGEGTWAGLAVDDLPACLIIVRVRGACSARGRGGPSLNVARDSITKEIALKLTLVLNVLPVLT